jgi:hypothetical protein
MSDTIKIGRKPNNVTIKRSEWHHEMFTTNLDRITKIITDSNELFNSLYIGSKHLAMRVCRLNGDNIRLTPDLDWI